MRLWNESVAYSGGALKPRQPCKDAKNGDGLWSIATWTAKEVVLHFEKAACTATCGRKG